MHPLYISICYRTNTKTIYIYMNQYKSPESKGALKRALTRVWSEIDPSQVRHHNASWASNSCWDRSGSLVCLKHTSLTFVRSSTQYVQACAGSRFWGIRRAAWSRSAFEIGKRHSTSQNHSCFDHLFFCSCWFRRICMQMRHHSQKSSQATQWNWQKV